MIPKQAYFYWGSKNISFLRYLTIKTFSFFNPLWKLYLYMPTEECQITPWPTGQNTIKFTGENYFDKLTEIENLEVIKFDFTSIGLSRKLSNVHKSDFLRWYLLSVYGGLWCDMDIVFAKPVTNINIEENTDIVICHRSNILSIGFMMSKPNCKYFADVLELAKTTYKADAYQSAGNVAALKIDYHQYKYHNLEQHIVYPFLGREKDILCIYSKADYSNDINIGLHWFGGCKYAPKYESQILPSNIADFNNILLGKYINNVLKGINL